MDSLTNRMKRGRRLAKEAATWTTADVRIAVLGSVALQQFVQQIRLGFYEQGIKAAIFEGEFRGLAMAVLDSESEFYRFQPDYVIILPHVSDIHAFPAVMDDEATVTNMLKDEVAKHERIWNLISQRLPNAQILQGNFVLPAYRALSNLDRQVSYGMSSYLEALNRSLAQKAPSFVNIADIDFLAGNYGRLQWLDETNWYLTKSPCAPECLPELVNTFIRLMNAMRGKVRKCLVLDLDNTLWGGTVGDLGWDGIDIDPVTPTGEAYQAFQRYLLALKQRGVILAVCSKNEEDIAKEAFVRNPNMVLSLDDIACFVANWEDKAANIRYIAKELNIGIDSLVFFDDNPAEREIVHQYLPEVMVIDVPDDPANYVQALDEVAPFDWPQLTKEDAARSASYVANKKRVEMEESFVDYDAYLAALDMSGGFHEIHESELARFTQLLNKSNQFNLRTRRYKEGEIRSMQENPSYCLLAGRLRDRFSDYGLISCIILKKEAESCFIDSWVMSCRVLKRGVEQMAFQSILAIAKKWQCQKVRGFGHDCG